MPKGKLAEFPNAADKPAEGYLPELTPSNMADFDLAIGTWHTHPDGTANLSAEDWQTFIQWPDLIHAIVGTDGVRWYVVEKGAVLNAP